MGNLTESNLITIDTPLKTGQRCIRIGNRIIPVGVGSMYEPAAGSNSAQADIILGVVDSQGKFQPFSFDGTEASNSGSSQEVQYYKSWNSTLPAPVPAASMDFYKCSYVNSNSWGGYKAVLNNGIYSFQSDSTHNLYYSDLLPVINHIYPADVSFQVTNLKSVLPRDPVFYAPLISNTTETGQSLTNNNVTYTYDSSIGSTVAVFNGTNSRLTTTNVTGIPTGSSPRCFSAWARIDGGSGTSMIMATTNGTIAKGSIAGLCYFYVNGQWKVGFTSFEYGPIVEYEFVSQGVWHHYLGNVTDSTLDFYIDGGLIGSVSSQDLATQVSEIDIGTFFDLANDTDYTRFLNGRVLACRIYDRALSSSEITALASQFTPTA